MRETHTNNEIVAKYNKGWEGNTTRPENLNGEKHLLGIWEGEGQCEMRLQQLLTRSYMPR